MTTTQLQLRRDTTANIDGVTPAQGEPVYDVTRKALVLGDGATAGGNCVTPFSGTWAPVLLGTIANPSVTYTTQTGWYIQVGTLVIVGGTIAISAISGGSGSVYIANLPASPIGVNGVGMIAGLGGFTAHSSSYTSVLLSPSSGGAIYFEEYGSGQPGNQAAVSQVGSSFIINFVAIYQAAQPTG